MKLGAVSLWLLLLLSEKPMYGYEIIRELERRFSGYWKPKTGTIYPALEKLERERLVTSRVEFREEAPDRKHYAVTEKGQTELAQSMAYWSKMTEVLENYREAHGAIARYKAEIGKEELSGILVGLGDSLRDGVAEIGRLFPVEEEVRIEPTEPLRFRFLYAKENNRLEIHMEIAWVPKMETNKAV